MTGVMVARPGTPNGNILWQNATIFVIMAPLLPLSLDRFPPNFPRKFGGNRFKGSGRSDAWFTSQKNNAFATHFLALSPKPIARFGWKRARLSLFRSQPPPAKFHPNPSKFSRFISENEVPDRYNNRRSDRYRIADNYLATVYSLYAARWAPGWACVSIGLMHPLSFDASFQRTHQICA